MIPSHYRKSEGRRKLYATQKFLAAHDDTTPVLKGEYDREVVKAAVDRRRALMEYEAADHFREYFRIERSEIVSAVRDGLTDVDGVLDSLRENLGITLTVVQRSAAEEWGDWARTGHGTVTKAFNPSQPRDDDGKWTAGAGTSPFSPMIHQIRAVLSPDLLHPKYRDAGKKSPDPSCAGHCYAAVEALYHLGAKDEGFKPKSIRHEDSVHWFLENEDGDILDPTATQFRKPVPYDQGVGRGFLTKEPSKRAQTIMTRVEAKGPVEKAVRNPVTSWLKRNLGTQIKGITETTRKKIAAVVANGVEEGLTLDQQADQIDALYLDEIIPNRSMTIARTEVGRAVNWSQQQIAEEVDVPMEKEWLSLDDDRTRATHADADGQRVGIDDAFEVGGSELQYPGDPSGPAEEVINCRCTVLHHVVDEQPRHKSARRVESPFQFAKSVLGVESPDVITMLAFAKGVFTEADEWTTARDIVMKHVYRLRRAQTPA